MHIEKLRKREEKIIGVRQKNGFCRTGGGGPESCGHVRNYYVFYAFPKLNHYKQNLSHNLAI